MIAALTCVCCARTFRTASAIVVACPICIQHFATTGELPDPDAKPFRKTPPPPKVAPKPKSEPAPVLTIVHYPTPHGICANLACQKPFTPYAGSRNQRYCTVACRFAANDARRAAREAARGVTA